MCAIQLLYRLAHSYIARFTRSYCRLLSRLYCSFKQTVVAQHSTHCKNERSRGPQGEPANTAAAAVAACGITLLIATNCATVFHLPQQPVTALQCCSARAVLHRSAVLSTWQPWLAPVNRVAQLLAHAAVLYSLFAVPCCSCELCRAPKAVCHRMTCKSRNRRKNMQTRWHTSVVTALPPAACRLSAAYTCSSFIVVIHCALTATATTALCCSHSS